MRQNRNVRSKNMTNKETTTKREGSWLRAFGVFAICVAATFVLPVIAIYGDSVLPEKVTDFLFFFPQFAFPYGGFVINETYRTRFLFLPALTSFMSIAQWILVAALFAWSLRRAKVRYLFPLAVGTIFLVAMVVKFCFSIAGIQIELDAP